MLVTTALMSTNYFLSLLAGLAPALVGAFFSLTASSFCALALPVACQKIIKIGSHGKSYKHVSSRNESTISIYNAREMCRHETGLQYSYYENVQHHYLRASQQLGPASPSSPEVRPLYMILRVLESEKKR